MHFAETIGSIDSLKKKHVFKVIPIHNHSSSQYEHYDIWTAMSSQPLDIEIQISERSSGWAINYFLICQLSGRRPRLHLGPEEAQRHLPEELGEQDEADRGSEDPQNCKVGLSLLSVV